MKNSQVAARRKSTAKASVSKKTVTKSSKSSKKPIASQAVKYAVLKRVGLYVVIPALFYFAFFWLYAGTWMGHFNTRFFSDQGDGFQNVWNMWWVNFSVTHLHQLPWHTTYLHYPYGTTLIGQTLNPFNGFVAIALLKVFSLVQAYNIMVIFSFVFGGMTTFWLCRYFTRKYIPSLIGGFIFTFSSYHFAHAIGHLQLVSLEWIPLFILLWWKLLKNPRYRYAVGAAIVLLLVLLCDYYYFLYCVATGGLILLYLWRRKELPSWKKASVYRPLIVFVILAGLLTAPLPIALLRENAHDPLLGAHNDRLFSTDVLTPIIDGGFWHFASITNGYWHHVKAYIAESSVYFSVSVIVLLIIGLWKRAKIHSDIIFWLILGFIFAVLSLGPRLMILGYSINHAPLPYALLEKLIPQLKLSGDPDRMIVMTMLAAAVISSMVLSKLNLTLRKHQLVLAVFFVVLAVELWPSVLPLNIASAYPKYVNALAKLPPGGVLDNGAISASWALYDQTIDHQPEALGYISRTPTSVQDKDTEFVNTVTPAGYPKLCSEWKIRYVTTPASRPLKTNFPIIYNDHQTLIYDVKDSPNC